MNGGTEVCNYWGNGTLIEDPRCICPAGYQGVYCEEKQELTQHSNTQHSNENSFKNPAENITLVKFNEFKPSQQLDEVEIGSSQIVSRNSNGSSESSSIESNPIIINHTQKLQNSLEWTRAATPSATNRYTGSGRRTS